MRLLRSLVTLAIPALLVASSMHSQAPTALALTGTPQLVDCEPVSVSPCMSASVTPVTASGAPAALALPPVNQLRGMFTLTGASGQVQPFYVSAGSGPDAAQHTSAVLLLIDISGSMNQPMAGSASRFEAAKTAIAQYIGSMQEGSDRIAIVPFESHNVVSTIRGAVFASRKSDVLAQLNALPAPGAKNNTGLYQAVFSGEEVLANEVANLKRSGDGDLQPHLIVMTDGRNEVMPGDDAQLLTGDLGLQQAAAQVQASHVDTIGIGFGDPAAIDSAAMKRLSTRFLYASDSAQLLAALHTSRPATSHSIHLTWLLPESSRVSLAGHDPEWIPTLRLADGANLSGPAMRLLSPATEAPAFDRKADHAELQSLIATHPAASSGWSIVLVHGLCYLAAGAIMLVLWFWVPRLVWGDRYQSAQRVQRWSSERRGVTSASGVQVRSVENTPAGFSSELQSSPLQRSAAQTTQIQPRGEFSRTRLSFEKR